jgi:hypothetical protein
MDQAIARDPQNWVYRYGLALAQAADGRDPRPVLAYAEALDPLEPMIQTAVSTLRGGNPRSWPRAARTLEMPVSTRE